jgi:hypothetical protein
MTLDVTLALAAAMAALAVLFGWLGARPPNPHKGPRLAPYRFMMMMCAAAAILFVVHVVNLLGVTTGR